MWSYLSSEDYDNGNNDNGGNSGNGNPDDKHNTSKNGDITDHISIASLSSLFLFLSIGSALVALFVYTSIPETAGIMLEDADDLFFWDESDAMIPCLSWLPCSLRRSCIGRRRFLIQDRHGLDEDEGISGGGTHSESSGLLRGSSSTSNRYGSHSTGSNEEMISNKNKNKDGTDSNPSQHKYSEILRNQQFVFDDDNDNNDDRGDSDDTKNLF